MSYLVCKLVNQIIAWICQKLLKTSVTGQCSMNNNKYGSNVNRNHLQVRFNDVSRINNYSRPLFDHSNYLFSPIFIYREKKRKKKEINVNILLKVIKVDSRTILIKKHTEVKFQVPL